MPPNCYSELLPNLDAYKTYVEKLICNGSHNQIVTFINQFQSLINNHMAFIKQMKVTERQKQEDTSNSTIIEELLNKVDKEQEENRIQTWVVNATSLLAFSHKTEKDIFLWDNMKSRQVGP